MAGRIRDLSSGVALPQDVIVDTNLLVARFLSPYLAQTSQRAALDARRAVWFFSQVANGITMGWITTTAAGEVLHKLIRAKFEADIPNFTQELQNKYGAKKYYWNDLYKIRPGLLQRYRNDLQAVLIQMLNFGLYVIQPWDLGDLQGVNWEDELVRKIDRYRVTVNDSAILIDAQRLGIMNVISLDRDYLRAKKDFDVYTWMQ